MFMVAAVCLVVACYMDRCGRPTVKLAPSKRKMTTVTMIGAADDVARAANSQAVVELSSAMSKVIYDGSTNMLFYEGGGKRDTMNMYIDNIERYNGLRAACGLTGFSGYYIPNAKLIDENVPADYVSLNLARHRKLVFVFDAGADDVNVDGHYKAVIVYVRSYNGGTGKFGYAIRLVGEFGPKWLNTNMRTLFGASATDYVFEKDYIENVTITETDDGSYSAEDIYSLLLVIAAIPGIPDNINMKEIAGDIWSGLDLFAGTILSPYNWRDRAEIYVKGEITEFAELNVPVAADDAAAAIVRDTRSLDDPAFFREMAAVVQRPADYVVKVAADDDMYNVATAFGRPIAAMPAQLVIALGDDDDDDA